MQITVRVEGPVHVHAHDQDELHRIEAKLDRSLALLRRVLQATVTDPAELEMLAKESEDSTAQLQAVIDAAKPAVQS